MPIQARVLNNFILALVLIAGCTTSPPPRTDSFIGVRLCLVVAGNATAPWPPSLLVERRDGSGVSVSNGLSSLGAEYVPGVAVLMAINLSDKPHSLYDWGDPKWKVVIEREDGTRNDFALFCGGRSLPSLARSVVTLEPGQTSAIVIGLADYLPYNPQYMKEPTMPCRMHVEYTDCGNLRSNDIIIARFD